MHFVVAHVYVTSLIVASLLLITGSLIVTTRAPIESSNTEATWGGAGGVAFLNAIGARAGSSGRVRTESLLQQQAREHTQITIAPTYMSETVVENANLEWESLLSQLVRPAGETRGDEEQPAYSLYSFIPSGLISAPQTKQRTELQYALFEYGNSVGSYIQGFDDLHGNMLQVLKDAYEDRGDKEKVGRAIQIGADYIQLGREIESMDGVPKIVSSAHSALAKAYQAAGQNMIAKLRTSTDEEFVSAVNTYNESVENFTKRYIALVTIFEVAEVQFSQDDPGKVFMFQSSPSF